VHDREPGRLSYLRLREWHVERVIFQQPDNLEPRRKLAKQVSDPLESVSGAETGDPFPVNRGVDQRLPLKGVCQSRRGVQHCI
jgi:hypothetical protein